MAINIRFFASLKETLNLDQLALEINGDLSVEEVWNQATACKPLPDNVLCAVNQQMVNLDHPINDGDEVAFFPPVTGG